MKPDKPKYRYWVFLLFQFCDPRLEVPLISMNMYHLEFTPESYNLCWGVAGVRLDAHWSYTTFCLTNILFEASLLHLNWCNCLNVMDTGYKSVGCSLTALFGMFDGKIVWGEMILSLLWNLQFTWTIIFGDLGIFFIYYYWHPISQVLKAIRLINMVGGEKL